MRAWEGIRADTDSSGPGCELAVNVSFYLDGEITRRYGMEHFTAQSGTALAQFSNVMTGRYVLFATSTGTIEAVSA